VKRFLPRGKGNLSDQSIKGRIIKGGPAGSRLLSGACKREKLAQATKKASNSKKVRGPESGTKSWKGGANWGGGRKKGKKKGRNPIKLKAEMKRKKRTCREEDQGGLKRTHRSALGKSRNKVTHASAAKGGGCLRRKDRGRGGPTHCIEHQKKALA